MIQSDQPYIDINQAHAFEDEAHALMTYILGPHGDPRLSALYRDAAIQRGWEPLPPETLTPRNLRCGDAPLLRRLSGSEVPTGEIRKRLEIALLIAEAASTDRAAFIKRAPSSWIFAMCELAFLLAVELSQAIATLATVQLARLQRKYPERFSS